MIDQSIHEVYQRDKKVFIPDFGAIIYSEVTDKIDFNDLLTFDDGKIIAEMQKQQQISEEEARNELDEYVQRVKSALNQGQLHFFAGIGYLSKDSQGSYAIEKATSTTDDQSEAKEPEPAKAKKKQIKKPTSKSVKKPRTKTKKEVIVNEAVKGDEPVSEEEIDQVPLKDQIEPIAEEEVDLESLKDQAEPVMDEELPNDANVELEAEEELLNVEEDDTFMYNPILSEEDENVQEYYKRKEKLNNQGKKRSTFATVMWILLPIILVAIAAFYYFNYYNSANAENKEEVKESNLSKSTSDEIKAVTPEEQMQTAQAVAEVKNENKAAGKTNEPDVPQTNKQKNPVASPAVSNSSKVSQTSSGQNKIYSLILGSFKVEDNADKFHQRLQEQGKDVSKFQLGNAFYFVGFEYIEGKSNAVQMLTEFQVEEPTAWIIRKQ